MLTNKLVVIATMMAVGTGGMLNPKPTIVSIYDLTKIIYVAEAPKVDDKHTTPEIERIVRILKDLRLCESTNNDAAINPMDLDGTPSYSRYQFKPMTLYGFAIEFGLIEKETTYKNFRSDDKKYLMNGEFQEVVLKSMIGKYGDAKEFWMKQFPGCSAKYQFWNY